MRALRALGALLVAPGLADRASRGDAISPCAPEVFDARPALLFLPGFYGSTLRVKGGGRRVFVSAREAYLGSEALSLFQRELATPAGPEIEMEGVLGAVTVIPWLYEVDVYARFLRRTRELCPEAQVIPVCYDWRADLSLAVGSLDETVKALVARGCRSITVVAHSMGGQALAYYLAYGAQPPDTAKLDWSGARHVQRAAFFGTPFRGSMIAFRSFDKGSGLPQSDRLLPADTMSSFPSMFELLPRQGTLFDLAGAANRVDLHDAELWQRYRFGLYRRPSLPQSALDARGKFVRHWLARSRRWSELLEMLSPPSPPLSLTVLNVASSRYPTLDAGYLDPQTGRLYFDPSDVRAAGLDTAPLFRGGDGTVTMASAAVPAALEAVTKQVLVDSPHESLFLDPRADQEYKSFLENSK